MQGGSAIVLFAHGAKDPQWSRPIERIQAAVRRELPQTPVELAFLEHMQPTLEDAVSRLASDGATRITIVPLFLAAGGHVTRDLPLLIARLRARHSGVKLAATAPIGEDEELVAAISAWVVNKTKSP